MSRRILQDQGRALNQTLANLDNFYQRVGKPVNVYKFRKVSGMIKMTNLGEQTLKYPNNKYQQTTNVYTGKEPVVVVWEGSTIAEGKDLRIIKHVTVGTYYEMYSTGANVNTLETTTLSLLGKEYVNTLIDRDITLQSDTWLPTSDDMTEFVYLILDPINQSQQWLEISSCTPIFNEETKKFQYSEINFNNINLKYSTTGKTLLDFIQFGGIGEGYCFPVETTNDKGEVVVSLDSNKLLLNGKGTNQVQFDFNSGAGNSDFLIFGRKKETMNEDGTIEMEAPHMLWLYRCNFPKSSQFFYNTPNLNSYAMFNTQPTKQGIWASYKEAYKGNNIIGEYNILNTKEVLTGFKHDVGAVRNTNPNVSTYINWDNKKSLLFRQALWMEANPYFKTANPFFFMSRYMNYCEFFNINAMINFYSDVISYEYTETTKYKLSDIFGIVGSIVNLIVGGLNIGWTSTRTLAPAQPINLLVPCISFEDGKSALADTAPLPTDIFIDDQAQKVLPTATKILTSWNFSLTDRCLDNKQIKQGQPVGKGGNGVWDLKYIGQTKYEDGTWINEDHSPLKINLDVATPTLPSSVKQEWIIDYVVFRAVANCDMRISAYSSDGESIYSMFMETNGKARKEPTIWANRIKFNYYDEFNTLGQVVWPTSVEEAHPDLKNLVIDLNDLYNEPAIDIQIPQVDFRPTTSSGWGTDYWKTTLGALDASKWEVVGENQNQLINVSYVAQWWDSPTSNWQFREGVINVDNETINKLKQPFSFQGKNYISRETAGIDLPSYQYLYFSFKNLSLTDFFIEIKNIPITGEWYTETKEIQYLTNFKSVYAQIYIRGATNSNRPSPDRDFIKVNANTFKTPNGSSQGLVNVVGSDNFQKPKLTINIRYINGTLEFNFALNDCYYYLVSSQRIPNANVWQNLKLNARQNRFRDDGGERPNDLIFETVFLVPFEIQK